MNPPKKKKKMEIVELEEKGWKQVTNEDTLTQWLSLYAVHSLFSSPST